MAFVTYCTVLTSQTILFFCVLIKMVSQQMLRFYRGANEKHKKVQAL